jgi:hypothetical protein
MEWNLRSKPDSIPQISISLLRKEDLFLGVLVGLLLSCKKLRDGIFYLVVYLIVYGKVIG